MRVVQDPVDRLLTAEELDQITCAQRSGEYGDAGPVVGLLLGHIRQLQEALRWAASRRDTNVCDH